MKQAAAAAVVVAVLLSSAVSSGEEWEKYTVDVESKLVNIVFESRADVEDIVGTVRTAKGEIKVTRDLSKAEFEVRVPVDQMRTGIDLRDEHMRSDQWLDERKHPYVTFKGDSVERLRGDKYRISGTFSVHGVERPLSVEATVRRIDAKTAVRAFLPETDFLSIRADFSFKLSDFNIHVPEGILTKMSDTWNVRISLFAMRK